MVNGYFFRKKSKVFFFMMQNFRNQIHGHTYTHMRKDQIYTLLQKSSLLKFHNILIKV